jgi:hypothetical protein
MGANAFGSAGAFETRTLAADAQPNGAFLGHAHCKSVDCHCLRQKSHIGAAYVARTRQHTGVSVSDTDTPLIHC